MKLGLLPAREDHRTLRYRAYIQRTALPPLPPSTNYRAKVQKWPWLLNDKIGDCAIVSVAHSILGWTSNDADPGDNEAYCPSESEVVKAYSACSGYDPRTGANDNGCVMLDVLNYWRQKGVGGRKLLAYAKLDVRSHADLMEAVYLFGGALLGVQLPRAIQQNTSGGEWLAPKNPTGIWQPGSWGGHAVKVIDYDQDRIYIATWGGVVKMSWLFYETYCTEAYVGFSSDWFGKDSQAPNGFSWGSLSADFAAITGQPPPVNPIPIPPPAPPPPIPVPPAPVPGNGTRDPFSVVLRIDPTTKKVVQV